MLNKRIVFFIFILLNCASCKINTTKRNSILVKTSISELQDSIIKLNKILSKLVDKNARFYYHYKENQLFINGKFVGDAGSMNSSNISGLSILTGEERITFLRLSKYLLDNYISGCYNGNNSNVWFYAYKETGDNDFDDIREIVIADSETDTRDFRFYNKILDQKGKLLLIAAKDAKIY